MDKVVATIGFVMLAVVAFGGGLIALFPAKGDDGE